MPIQPSGGAMTHVIRSGHGPEDGLLLHCMLADARALDGLSAKLAAELTALSMDLPGHGQSEDWDKSRDYGEMTRDMAAGLLERPAHVIGHSYGGYAALRLAVDRPDLVRSLTLIEPVFFAAAQRSDPAVLKAYRRKASAFIGAFAVGDLVSAARGFTAIWGNGQPWESLKPGMMDYITQRIALVAASEPGLMEDNGGVLDRLADVDLPCLIVQGANSPPVIGSICAALEADLQNTRREMVADAGHMVAISHAADVAALIAEFLVNQPRSSEIS